MDAHDQDEKRAPDARKSPDDDPQHPDTEWNIAEPLTVEEEEEAYLHRWKGSDDWLDASGRFDCVAPDGATFRLSASVVLPSGNKTEEQLQEDFESHTPWCLKRRPAYSTFFESRASARERCDASRKIASLMMLQARAQWKRGTESTPTSGLAYVDRLRSVSAREFAMSREVAIFERKGKSHRDNRVCVITKPNQGSKRPRESTDPVTEAYFAEHSIPRGQQARRSILRTVDVSRYRQGFFKQYVPMYMHAQTAAMPTLPVPQDTLPNENAVSLYV